MNTDKQVKFKSYRYLNKTERSGTYSPRRLTSSVSDKCLWTNQYKNQPRPINIYRRIIISNTQKYFDMQSDEEIDITPVEEVDEIDIHQKKKSKLSKYKIMGDLDEFYERKNRIKSEKRNQYSSSKRCNSVSSLKLPQVIEDRKEDDELERLGLSKLSQVKDRNQFNTRKLKKSSGSHTDVASKVQSLQFSSHYSPGVPQLIPQTQAEYSKSVKLPNEKSIITTEIQKLIVDELDQRKKKKQEQIQEIECIEEEKHEQQIDTCKLGRSLEKFDNQIQYMKNHADDQSKITKIESHTSLNIPEQQQIQYHQNDNELENIQQP